MAGINAVSVSPPELLRLPVGPSCAIVGVSASGRSLVTIEALEFAKSLGATTVALTDNPAGKVAQTAEILWQTRSGIESYNISPSAPTTAALAYLLALASRLPSPVQGKLQHDCHVLESKVKEIIDWSERQGIAISKLAKRGGLLYIISDGPNYVAAQIGMMKLDEFSVVKGLATLKEEFQHHYNLSIDKDERAVLVLDDPISPKDEDLSAAIESKLQMKTYLLHTSTLGLVTPLAQAIPNTIALQMASYHAVRKYDPNKSGFKQPHADAFKIY
jgi:glucosamine 6-phosphate synthetase-like amidotransferase/phosphosugar isomerase protein